MEKVLDSAEDQATEADQAADLDQEAVPEEDQAAASEADQAADLIQGQEPCTKLHVRNVEQNVKFHLNQQKEDQFIAGTAFKSINPRGFKWPIITRSNTAGFAKKDMF